MANVNRPPFFAPPPRNARCETFELRDRVSEACEAFIANSPEWDDDGKGDDRKQGQELPGAADTWYSMLFLCRRLATLAVQ